MDKATARRYLDIGVRRLQQQDPVWLRRQAYLEGDHDLPFAPEGVSVEYLSLRKQSIANWMPIAMGAPIQRMRADGIRRGKGDVDLDFWTEVAQPNHLDARQQIVFLQSFVHGRGIWSVSKNPSNPDRPRICVENSRRVWIEADPADPFTSLFAVKTFTVDDEQSVTSSLVLSPAVRAQIGKLKVAYVYGQKDWHRFEKRGEVGDWEHVSDGFHGLGELPFVASDSNVDTDGVPHSAIEQLMPQQDAMNTIRFNTLLAMQFSAFRQRVFTGYDPVVRDGQGNALVKRDADGVPILDADGQQQPVIRKTGRVGVDRALVFPGEATKVFDLPESDLANYIAVYSDFLSSLFASAQVPPQYLLTKMANLSGDALTGAESTLKSLVAELKRTQGEALETVARLANIARGQARDDDYAIEIVWADTEARSFAQIVDGIVKLINVGFPKKSAFEMLPDATPPKVDEWMKQIENERGDEQSIVRTALAALDGPATPDPDAEDSAVGV